MNLLSDVPVFYWLQSLTKNEAEEALVDTVKSSANINVKVTAARIAVFYGTTSYRKVLIASKVSEDRLYFPLKQIHHPDELFHHNMVNAKMDEAEKASIKLSAHLSQLAMNCSTNRDPIKRAEA